MIKRLFLYLILIFSVTLMICGCTDDKNRVRGDLQEETGGDEACVYYLNRENTGIKGVAYEGSMDADSFISALSSEPKDTTLKNVLGELITVKSVSLSGGTLVLDLSKEYLELDPVEEVLLRASVVRTLCQAKEVESVIFTCEGDSLEDSKGVPYGAMTADNFVDGTRSETGSYERREIVLYFADQSGNHLVPETRTVVFSTNVAIEKIILEHLMAGPSEEGHRRTLAKERALNSISIKDGICYVDFSEPVIDFTGMVTEEVSVYSIVNSLTDIPGINKVQISIDGESDRTFRGSVRLDEMFERNLDLITAW